MKTNNKNVVRLTESQLKAMVAESVREALSEIGDTNRGQYMLGRLTGRKTVRGDENGAGDAIKHAKDNNMNYDMGDDYFRSGGLDYLYYSNPKTALKPRVHVDDNGFKEYDFPDGSEEEERLHASNRIKNIPKSAKDAVGAIEDFPEHAYGPMGFYDKYGHYLGRKVESKNGNELSRLSESKLYKIVSESIDRILKNK